MNELDEGNSLEVNTVILLGFGTSKNETQYKSQSQPESQGAVRTMTTRMLHHSFPGPSGTAVPTRTGVGW